MSETKEQLQDRFNEYMMHAEARIAQQSQLLRDARLQLEKAYELKDDVLSILHMYRDYEPEEDESWESWYYAAFDLACGKVRDLFKKSAVTDEKV